MVFVENIEELTLANTDYRRVIFTSDYSQLVLMSIPVGEQIDLEIHPYIDQFFRIEQGQGVLVVGKNGKDGGKDQTYHFEDRFAIVVPHNTYHRIINTGSVPIKLYTIYSPPNHPKDKVEHIKESKKDEKKDEGKIEYIRKLASILL